jgi:hypothetical protein
LFEVRKNKRHIAKLPSGQLGSDAIYEVVVYNDLTSALCVLVKSLKGQCKQGFGGVSEWPKEHAWKVCIPQGIEGSNPSPTAII